jgi:hypothetical protein
MRSKIDLLKLIEKIRWCETTVHWAEFFLLVTVLSSTVDLSNAVSKNGDLLFSLLAHVAEHGWLVGILFITRTTKSILKVRKDTLHKLLEWELAEEKVTKKNDSHSEDI